MNRNEYLSRLRQYLEKGGLGIDDIEDAVRYYEEIFLDAGEENEGKTAENLGSPEELARKILIDNGIHCDGEPTYQVNSSYSNGTNYNNSNNNTNSGYGRNPQDYDEQRKRNNLLLKIIIVILTFPIWISIAAAVGGVAFGLLVAAIAIVFAFIVTGVVCTVCGIVAIFTAPPAGLVVLGVGLVFIGLSGLIILPAIKGLWHLGVRLFNWIISIIRRIFNTGRVNVN